VAALTAQLGQQQGGGGGRRIAEETEVAKPQIFDGTPSKVSGFVGACRIYIKTRLREVLVEAQINWVLSFVQGGSADIWKENMLEELETGEIEFESIGEFLAEVRREFGGGDEESVKVAELKKIEQGGRTMEEFVQDFKRTARESGYEERPLVEEFKRGMNGGIRRKLMEAENPPTSIEQWYRRATALDINWRESRREEERLRRRKETTGGAPKQEQKLNMPRPLVWQRRQQPPQQATIGPAPMEGVERTNAAIVTPQQRVGFPQRNPYAMDVDRRDNRTCFACGGFGHMARFCRNRGMMSRKVEVNSDNSNLNGEGDLVSPN